MLMARTKEKESKKKEKSGIAEVMEKLRKDYGEGAVMYMKENPLPAVERISCGIWPLDAIIGGGLPVGRIIEIYGPESSGKTTICLKAVAEVQKEGGTCAYIDAEHALDPVYAEHLGVDVPNLIISQPDSGEMALDVVENFVRTGEVRLIIVDSVAALTPQSELDGEIGDQNIGVLARLMGQAMRKLTSLADNARCTVIFINQIREKINGGYGNPETTPGGRALKFFASLRLDVRRRDPIKQSTEIVGNKTVVKAVKNKTYPPFKECAFDIIFDKGPDVNGYLADTAIELGLADKAGAWVTYNNQKYNGRNAFAQFLGENEEEAKNLRKLIAETMRD